MTVNQAIEILEAGIDLFDEPTGTDLSPEAMRMGVEALKAYKLVLLNAEQIIDGEPVWIEKDNQYYVVDHQNDDAVFFVGRGCGVLKDEIGEKYRIYNRKPM